MSFYLFNLTPPLLEGSPPSPSLFVKGNPPSYNEKTYGFFYEGIYVHPFISPSRPFCGDVEGIYPPHVLWGL